MSLEEIARITRIPERSLERLESGDFESLPADVFVRGFLRSYAQCVGLDADDALRRYAGCGLTPAPVAQHGKRAATSRDAVAEGTPAPEVIRREPSQPMARGQSIAVEPIAVEPVVLGHATDEPAPAVAATVDAEGTAASEPVAANQSTKKKRKRRRKGKTRPMRTEGTATAAVPPAPVAPAPVAAPEPVAPEPVAPVSVAAPEPVVVAAAPVVAPARMVLAIDDDAPDDAERVLSDRAAREGAEREASRRAFLPPALLDHEDGSRRGALTLAVIILVIVATLTMSYLLRRPSSSGSGVTELPPAGDASSHV